MHVAATGLYFSSRGYEDERVGSVWCNGGKWFEEMPEAVLNIHLRTMIKFFV
jgi:hypothetical protein